MMRLPTFRYVAASSLDEAAAALSESGGAARLVAGGTDLWPNMKRRHQSAETVIGLRGVKELHGIDGDPATGITLGAMTTLTAICRDPVLREHHPGLVKAVGTISTPVLRNMGTLGGNLCLDTRCTYYNQNEEWRRSIGYCMKEVGETCWVAPGSSRCWAVSSSDSAPLLCAVGAQVRLHSVAGTRQIRLEELYQDDGISYLTKAPDEILVDVTLPPSGTMKATYWKLRRRGSIDFPVLGVGAALSRDEAGRVTAARLFLGGVKSLPIDLCEAASALVGEVPDAARIAEVAERARKAALPMDNTDYEMKWRRHMTGLYVEGAFRELAGLPERVRPSPHGAWTAV